MMDESAKPELRAAAVMVKVSKPIGKPVASLLARGFMIRSVFVRKLDTDACDFQLSSLQPLDVITQATLLDCLELRLSFAGQTKMNFRD